MTDYFSIGSDQYPSTNSFGDPSGVNPPVVLVNGVFKNLEHDYACKINFSITDADPLDTCALYVYSECAFSTDMGKTWRVMTPWNQSNPKGLHPDWTLEALPIGSQFSNTFVWDVASDVPCPEFLENVLIQIVVTDGKFNSDPETVSTDDFIDILYNHPVGDKIHVGYRVFSSRGGGICVDSFSWSRDGKSWFPITADLDDPAHSENPIESNVENILVWDFSKDTTDPNDTCIKISTIRPGDANPIQRSVNVEDFDHIYHNGASVYYEGKLYAAFGRIDAYTSTEGNVATYTRINTSSGSMPFDTFMIIDVATGSVDYKHMDVNAVDFNGNPMWIGGQPFQSHASHIVDRKNGRWYLLRGYGNTMQFLFYEFSTGRWRILFQGNPGINIGLRQLAYWDYDGWWYLYGGFRGGHSPSPAYFYRINIEGLLSGSLIIELLNHDASGSGMVSGSIGRLTYTSNPITNIDVVVPTRWDVRGRVIPGQDGNAIIVGGVPDNEDRNNFIIFNLRNWSIEQRPIPVNDTIANYELLDQNGTIVLIGGRSDGRFATGPFTINRSVWLYNPCVRRFIVYPDIEFTPKERMFVAQNPENQRYFVFGGRGQFHDDAPFKTNEWDLVTPEVFTNQVECPVFFTHGNIWEFGPGAEYSSPQNAFRGMINFYKGDPIQEDQIITGSPDGVYRGEINLNDIWYDINSNGHEVILTSLDDKNRVTLSPSIVMNKGMIHKYDDENITVWSSSQPRCIEHIDDALWVYEDGIQLERVESLEEVNNRPGSFFYDSILGDVFIHATDSSMVRSNDKEYTMTAFRSVISHSDPTFRIDNLTISDIDFVEFALVSTSDRNSVLSFKSATNDISINGCRFHGNGQVLYIDNGDGVNSLTGNLAHICSNLPFTAFTVNGESAHIERNVSVGRCDDAVGYDIDVTQEVVFARNAVDFFRQTVRVIAFTCIVKKNIIRGTESPNGSVLLYADSSESLVYSNAFMRIHPGDLAVSGHGDTVLKNNTFIVTRDAEFDSEPIISHTGSLISKRNLFWLHEWCVVYDNAPNLSNYNAVFHYGNFGWQFPGDTWTLDTNSRVIEDADPIVSGYSDDRGLHHNSVFTNHSAAKRIQDEDTVHAFNYDIMDSNNQCPLDAGCCQSGDNRSSFRVKMVHSSKWPPRWMDLIVQNDLFNYFKYRSDESQYRNKTYRDCP